MDIYIKVLMFSFLMFNIGLHPFQVCYCRKSLVNKSLKKLTKSEVQVKTYLLPCSVDKDILNSTSGPSHHHLHNCKRKFVIIMSVNSGGEYCSKTDGFISISYVIDGMTGRKKRLLNPFMIRLKREKMYQLYDLQLVKSVNAEAKEEVKNYENTPNYTGCDTSSSHPTCGFSFYNNKIIQYSEGFCCSCDQSKNDERQPCESHSQESKDFPDMEYSAHQSPSRSNRTSRDLETAQEKSKRPFTNAESIKDQPAAVQTISSLKFNSPIITYSIQTLDQRGDNYSIKPSFDTTSKSENNPMSSKNSLHVNSCEDFKPALSDEFWLNNVTVKSFEFEHSVGNIEQSYSVSPLNILIDSELENEEKLGKQGEPFEINGTLSANDKKIVKIKLGDREIDKLTDMEEDLNEYFDSFKHSVNVNNPIDNEQFKLLMMKRIKNNKNREQHLNDQNLKSNETASPIYKKIRRNINRNSNHSNFQRYDFVQKTGKNGFSLKLESGNSELRLQIITKRPNNTAVGQETCNISSEQRVKKPHRPSNKTFVKNDTLKDDEHTEHTTKKSIKERIIQNSVLKYFKSGGNKKTTSSGNPKLFNISCYSVDSTSTTVKMRYPVQNSNCSTTLYNALPTTRDPETLHLPKNNKTKIKNIDINEGNLENNFTDVESLMQKLVPVINTVHNIKTASSKSRNFADGILADSDNTTYKVYIELKKNIDSGEDKRMNSSCKNQSSFNLKNQDNSFELKNNLPKNCLSPAAFRLKNEEKVFEDEPLRFANISQVKNSFEIQFPDDSSQNIHKREAACDTQIRGGQSCLKEGKAINCNGNPETYFESAHCLRFSELWFNVFKLSNPRLENSITVKVYAKHKAPDKRICWENLSKRIPGRVGTVNEVLTDEAKKIMITYSSEDKVAFSLDCASDYLLVPQPLPRHCKDSELEILSYGGPEEYLVLKGNEITFDGEECDKVGVSYPAFARQPNRCQQEAGTCLRNQPLHYWRKDKEAVKDGKRGQYFLKNFIEVTDQAILQNTTSSQVVLRAPYFERYKSQVIVEMDADHIEIIGDKSEGQITEVYTDATSDKVTVVKVVVTNLGVAVDFFGVDFANCSSQLGPSDFDKPGKDEIPPQHRITYTATISSSLRNRRVECKMVLYNQDQEVVASRHIVVVQGQRCMCVWHCRCVCHNYPDPGLPCRPLSVRDYNRAGFPGHLPITVGSDSSTLFTVLNALLWFFLFLLLFGLVKAVLGLCFSIIALWGLWYILPDEARSLQTYLEPQYTYSPVVRDCDGFPINPQSHRRNEVHFLPWYSEFIVNVFFFICVFRSCLCDQGSHRGSNSGFYPSDPYHPRSRARNRCCSPSCSVRHQSPCGSVCSNRRNRKFRISAGAEEEFLNPDSHLLRDDEWAKRLVAELTQSYVVFRVLTRPMGGVKSVPGTPYCVRGFFLESENGVYEFTPPSPLMQMRQMDGSPLDPPVMLDPAPFHALYHSAREVLGAHELSPWARGVVINAPY